MPPPPIPLRLTAPAATRAIRDRAADTGRIILTDHAQERMDERGITFPEVLGILRDGTVHVPPLRQPGGEWKAEMERRMPGGREAVVVTVIRVGDDLVVVTVMWRDKR